MRFLLKLMMFFMMIFFANKLYAINLNGMSVKVEIDDSVDGGCWTNLREVRTYAEEKLYQRGAKITQDYGFLEDNHYRLLISVTGGKLYANGTGPCTGSYDVRLDGFMVVKGHPVWAVFSEGGWHQSHKTSLNSLVNNVVNQFFRDVLE